MPHSAHWPFVASNQRQVCCVGDCIRAHQSLRVVIAPALGDHCACAGSQRTVGGDVSTMTCLPFSLLRTLYPKTKRITKRKNQPCPLVFWPRHYAAMSLAASLQNPRSSTGRNQFHHDEQVNIASKLGTNVRPNLKLLDLPDDVLQLILRCLTRPPRTPIVEGDVSGVQLATLRQALPVAQTCKRLHSLLYSTLDNVCLWSPNLEDAELKQLAKNAGPHLRRLVVRGCVKLTNDSVYSLTLYARRLRAIDLSFVCEVSDSAIETFCSSTSGTLEKLLLRKCNKLTDLSLIAAGKCTSLEIVDFSYCSLITDTGVDALVAGCGNNLRLLSMSFCGLLSDATLRSIGQHCSALQQLCARGLPKITDLGFATLCAGVGATVEGIDVLDCTSLTRDPVVEALRKHCPKIAGGAENDTEGKTLRQILVTTLRANIFIVHGCDPKSGRDTIHMVLVDNGDIVSANILSASTTDLSLLGVVLCKSYGSSLDEETKHELTQKYGILPSMLAE